MGTSLRTTMLALVPVLVVSTAATAQQSDRYTLAGEAVAVYDLIGNIEVVPGTGAATVVTVTRGGADAGTLRVANDMVLGVPSLRVIFPNDEYEGTGNSRTEMWVRDDGTFNGQNRRERGRRVRIGGGGDDAYADLRIEIPAGKSVSVNLGVGLINARNVNGSLRLDTSSGDVNARDTRGSLNIDTGSGDVLVQTHGGDLTVDTGSGNVNVSGVTGARVINIDTGSGNVRGNSFQAGELLVDTGSGSIDLAGVTAPVLNLDTGSGDVTLRLTADANDIRIDTGSGDVTLYLPGGFGSAVDLESSSGGVDTELPIQVTRRSEDRLVGRIGDGAGRMQVETGSGSIWLKMNH